MKRTRQPHRMLLKPPFPAVVLSFWTAQSIQIAQNACAYERAGDMENARDCWSIARDGSPADAVTRRFCDARAKVFVLFGEPHWKPEGEPIDLVQFITVNADGFAPEQLDQLRALPVGERWQFGGGAAPAGYVERRA